MSSETENRRGAELPSPGTTKAFFFFFLGLIKLFTDIFCVNEGVLQQQKEFPLGDNAIEAQEFSEQNSCSLARRKNSKSFMLDRNMSTDLEKGEIRIFDHTLPSLKPGCTLCTSGDLLPFGEVAHLTTGIKTLARK